jgi:hypothetical protein
MDKSIHTIQSDFNCRKAIYNTILVFGNHMEIRCPGGRVVIASASRTEDRGFESPPGCKELGF